MKEPALNVDSAFLLQVLHARKMPEQSPTVFTAILLAPVLGALLTILSILLLVHVLQRLTAQSATARFVNPTHDFVTNAPRDSLLTSLLISVKNLQF